MSFEEEEILDLCCSSLLSHCIYPNFRPSHHPQLNEIGRLLEKQLQEAKLQLAIQRASGHTGHQRRSSLITKPFEQMTLQNRKPDGTEEEITLTKPQAKAFTSRTFLEALEEQGDARDLNKNKEKEKGKTKLEEIIRKPWEAEFSLNERGSKVVKKLQRMMKGL